MRGASPSIGRTWCSGSFRWFITALQPSCPDLIHGCPVDLPMQCERVPNTGISNPRHPLPGLDPGIHVVATVAVAPEEGVDGRVEPGRGDRGLRLHTFLQPRSPNRTTVDLIRASTEPARPCSDRTRSAMAASASDGAAARARFIWPRPASANRAATTNRRGGIARHFLPVRGAGPSAALIAPLMDRGRGRQAAAALRDGF